MTVKELLDKLPEARFDIYKQINHRDGTVEKVHLAYCPNKESVAPKGDPCWSFGNWKVLAYGLKEYAKDKSYDPYYDTYELIIKRR